jgi:hypothetical protein
VVLVEVFVGSDRTVEEEEEVEEAEAEGELESALHHRRAIPQRAAVKL